MPNVNKYKIPTPETHLDPKNNYEYDKSPWIIQLISPRNSKQ